MFGIGTTELLVLFVLGLLVLGPKRLPELARTVGRGLAEFRRASSDIRREFLDAAPSIHPDPAPEPPPAPAPPKEASGETGEAGEAGGPSASAEKPSGETQGGPPVG